jgi:hypothetical protein
VGVADEVEEPIVVPGRTGRWMSDRPEGLDPQLV